MVNRLGYVVFLIYAASELKFSEQVSHDEYRNILVDIEAENDEVNSAFQTGNMTAIKIFKNEGVFEKYINGYIYEWKGDLMSELRHKIHLLEILLSENLVTVPPEEFIKQYPNHDGLFNVSFLPKTTFVTTFLVNITKMKMAENKSDGTIYPLTLICSLPDVEPRTVKYLLNNGVDVNAKSPINTTAVFAAAERGNLPVLQLLVERGATVDLTFRSPLHNRFSTSWPMFMNLFYRKRITEVRDRFVNVSPLVVATFGKNIDVIRFLLNKTKKPMGTNDSWVVLYNPLVTENIEMTRILLEHGADPNAKDVLGVNALHRAAFAGNYKILKMLLEHNGDLNVTDDFGCTPLHVAALFSCDCKVLQLLLDKGSDVNAVNNGGFAPLNMLEAGLDLEFVIYLNENVPLDSKTKLNKTIRRPVADRKGHADVVRLLLDRGADVNHRDDVLGWSTLHWAAAIGDLEVVKLLVENFRASVNLKSKMGMTPSETAEYFGMSNVTEYFRTRKDSLQL